MVGEIMMAPAGKAGRIDLAGAALVTLIGAGIRGAAPDEALDPPDGTQPK